MPDAIWPYVLRAKTLFSLTDEQIADWLVLSRTRVKQQRLGYRRFTRPDGTVYFGPPTKEDDGARRDADPLPG